MSVPAGRAPHRPRTMLAMSPELLPRILGTAAADRLALVADLVPGVFDDFGTRRARQALAETEVLLSFWGCPPVDRAVLAAAPRLRAVVHAAGSVKYIVTPECRLRGIAVSSAAWANALPVAEYTVAAVLMSNKRLLQISADFRRVRHLDDWHHRYADVGNYRRTVGLVGASRIGRRVIELLRPYDLDLVVYDPYLGRAEAEALGVRRLGLDELCAVSDVLSLHAPALDETRGMIDRRRLALLPDGATVINTARGSLIDTEALVDELSAGRLHAVLDVTEPELLPADSPLYALPNVLLTPHVAGSVGGELHRMADSAVAELARYAAGQPFQHPVLLEEWDRTA
ncbi:hydroxyacid dehydrogenase [Streptacidiphilus sp. N1-3]|uniref:Hydroxyacid dehydrogenase n=1 Tax=Streptacidiphilus alkalitolerans TaxID=3342712 RepID=A0ABV6WVW0_9ACTN